MTAIGLSWLLWPASLPLYDAIGSDEPYRYVAPPPGYRHTPPPTSAHAALKVSAGTNAAGYANSSEVGPQFSLLVPQGALAAPVGDVPIVVTALPEAPRAPLPADGEVVGNVYRISATLADGRPADVVGTDGSAPVLQMRAPRSGPLPITFEHFDGRSWARSRTLRIGNDIYQSFPPVLGDWALVKLRHRSGSDGGSATRGVEVGLVSAAIGLVALAGVITVIRERRSRRPGQNS